MKTHTTLFALFAALLLIGAGCNELEQTQTNTADTSAAEVMEKDDDAMEKDDDAMEKDDDDAMMEDEDSMDKDDEAMMEDEDHDDAMEKEDSDIEALGTEDEDEDDVMEKEDTDDVMEKEDSDDAMEKEDDAMEKEDDTMEKEEQSAAPGEYVAYSESAVSEAATNGDAVLFFHASWCPTCKALNDDLEASRDDIPEGLTIFKTDYDTETALKQQYGVTYQHTLVQVDADGNQITKWSGGNTLESITAKVQ